MEITEELEIGAEEKSETNTSISRSCKESLKTKFQSKLLNTLTLVLVCIDVIIVILLLLLDLNVLNVGKTKDEQHKAETAEHVLHYIGLGILSLFLIEITLKMISFGKEFFQKKLEVFDAVIVILSFILDVTLSFAHVTDFVRDAAVLIISLRLWRIFKIVFGINICVYKKRKTIDGKPNN